MVNKSFHMRLWNVAFHKTRASCSFFSKLIRPLIAPMPYMCSNPLNMNRVVFCLLVAHLVPRFLLVSLDESACRVERLSVQMTMFLLRL